MAAADIERERPCWVGKPTGSKKTVDGMVFACWHTGIQRYEHRSPDGLIVITRNHRLTGYYCTVEGTTIRSPRRPSAAKAFRTFENAARAGIKLREGK